MEDLFNSLINQTCKEFDVFIVNDGVDGLQDFVKKCQNNNIVVNTLNTSSTIVQNRVIGLEAIRNDYDYIIWGDADDFFAPDRVEISIQWLKNYDIIVNDFTIIDAAKNILFEKYLSGRVINGQEIMINFIEQRNIFGLSNTAFKTDLIEDLTFDDNVIALDWYIYTQLLLKGHRAVFTNQTVTYYRQHSGNIIGIKELADCDLNEIRRKVAAKLIHYQKCIPFNERYRTHYNHLLQLEKDIKNGKMNNVNIASMLSKSKIKKPVWWEDIKILEDNYD